MKIFCDNKKYLLILIVFLTYTLGSFGFYHARTLGGDLNNHILSGEMFGVPVELEERGIKPLYYGPGQTGWDGQFYYYMSNDIFGAKDTAEHIDAPSYRYQRIGLSLYTFIVSQLLGQDWVSPTSFFVSYLLLVALAVWIGSRLLATLGIHPAWILLWGMGVGTQITVFNALPDAAADAFLILALAAVVAKRFSLSVVPFVMSALSREAYVLFPAFILMFYLIEDVIGQKRSGETLASILFGLFKWKSYYLLVLPGVVAVAWIVYITIHFGIAPKDQAAGILGAPFVAWGEYLVSGLQGNHKLLGVGYGAYAEAFSLLFFMAVLFVSFLLAVGILFNQYWRISVVLRGVAFTSLIFVMIYVCFGPTVVMHYTGYLKAVGVFLFLIPLMCAVSNIQFRYKVVGAGVLVTGVLLTSFYNLKTRILDRNISADNITQMSMVKETKYVECFNEYEAVIKVEGFNILTGSVFSGIFGGDRVIVDLVLHNTSDVPFVSSKNSGSVHMSYQWVDTEDNVVIDGTRTAIPDPLMPGQSTSIKVISSLPNSRDELYMRLSPVQEGCAWFYIRNPSVTEDIRFDKK